MPLAAQRPSGTVTFLFTDIEGSTRLVRELGERYAAVLDEHRCLLRDTFSRHGGHEVDAQGDAFFVAFARPRDAVLAAAEAQRALARHPWAHREVRVRMGVHSAEAQATREGYVGIGVHRGARVCAAAHGGQVLVSQTTRDLLEDEPLDGLAMRDLGAHRLKDLAWPQHLYQLEGPGLESSFPPPRTLEGRRTNLPVEPTPLVGREQELTEVHAALQRKDTRLLTLTGPAGTGKTRLALQAAAELVDDRADGVYFVPLASITDADLVPPAIAQALGLSEVASQSLDAFLASKELLLVLDNLEQCPDAGPRVGALLAGAPRVQVLATSREPLHVSAERLYPVPPLALPDLRRVDVDELASYASVALFVARAGAVDPHFALNTRNAHAVAEICVRVDGLPLAIELAAARVRLLTPEAIRERLGERLKLLTGGARDLPGRQRTLRDAIAWSYDLLESCGRRAFARLAVFVGGFTADAAEAVCDVGLDDLSSLVDESLVRPGGDRFALLETIREFALERLDESGEAEEIRRRHAEHFLALAEEAYAARLDDEARWGARLEADHDNLRAALGSLRARDRDAERRLAGALGWFWYAHSHFAEGRARLAPLVTVELDRSAESARALAAFGTLAAWQGDLAAAREPLERAVAISRERGDSVGEGLALESLAWAHFNAGDAEGAAGLAQRCLEVIGRAGRPTLVSRATSLICLMLVAQKDVARAEPLAREWHAAALATGDIWSEHFAEHYLGDCALISGDPHAALPRYRRSLEMALALGNVLETTFEIQGVAMAAAGIGEHARAVRLGAAADAAQRSLGCDVSGVVFWRELLERYLGPAQVALGAEVAAEATRDGATLDLDRAAAEALALAGSAVG